MARRSTELSRCYATFLVWNRISGRPSKTGVRSPVQRHRIRPMPRRCSALWISLLAALLAGSFVQRSAPAWTPEARLGRADAVNSDKAVLPFARLNPAPHFRSPSDRQSGPADQALPPREPERCALRRVIGLPADLLGAPVAKSARHFPLFPTGPPSHG